MTMALSLLLAFLTLGVTEAVIKPLAKWFVERRIRAALPGLFAALDPIMPTMIANYEAGALENRVREELSAITGQDWTKQEVETFFRLYDPRENARRIRDQARTG